ncbi:MAG: hypothetical protein WBF84_10595 [Castellaniella sp.]|uniref:hypothetical protein n=1 Tax=Castellaniella sp. TaxID=1955812 RepID=UPI003C790320
MHGMSPRRDSVPFCGRQAAFDPDVLQIHFLNIGFGIRENIEDLSRMSKPV